MLFVYSWNLCHLKNRGVNLHWFHSPIQLRLLSTQYHDASHSQFSILLHMATFSYKFVSNCFCAKFTFLFIYYISRLLFKTITYKCSLSIQRFADNSYWFLIVLEFRIFVKLKIKICIRILGVHQTAWHTKCDDEVLLHFNAFFFLSLSSWTHSMRWKKRTSMWRRCCLPQNWKQAVHTERIFIAFSRGISIIWCRTQESPKPCKFNCKFNFKAMIITNNKSEFRAALTERLGVPWQRRAVLSYVLFS